jgi:predicted nucleic acid-binding protein
MDRLLNCADSRAWFDALSGVDRARSDVIRSWTRDATPSVAPGFIHYEFTHIPTKRARRREMNPDAAAALMESLLSLDINPVDDDDLHRRALYFSASTPGLSGYDGHFVALCEHTGAELWTADKKLASFAIQLGVRTRLWLTEAA